MRDLPPGWATDVAVLELTGSTVEDHGDHLVVRSPDNPDYHWGNFVFVTEPDLVDEADRWVTAFHQHFPRASYLAIGLARMPDDGDAWTQRGAVLEAEEVLTTRTMPPQTPMPDGYSVRPLGVDDWEQLTAREIADNVRTGDYEPVSHARFAAARTATQRALSDRGDAAFFGAFAGDILVASLGIVRCGTIARYQSVVTDPEHRRRGLASHLLGVAARWAAAKDCTQWVILTDVGNPAGRIYRRLGFEPTTGNAQAYRKPPR
jgi:GNAT superfamily N-acetyltransferase